MPSNLPPLAVDLDGTLIRSDLLLESLLALLKRNPLYLFMLIVWLFRGKAAFKRAIASRIKVDPALLPYNQGLLEWLKGQREQGRTLILATASDRLMVEPLFGHVGIFDELIASDGHNNLAGAGKARALVERFGEGAFAYAGDGEVDLAVWQVAASGVVVSPCPQLRARAAALTEIEANFGDEAASSTRDFIRAIRPHQWLKNLLIFVPLLTSHSFDGESFLMALAAFVVFSMCASSVYLLNDMLDLAADRLHPKKRLRPFASGGLSLRVGIVATPLLLLGAFAIAWWLPIKFLLVLAGYYLLTLGYSLWLKQQEVVDVLLLASLYTIRIIAGGVAIGVALSFWLLAFSMFLFLSLAMVKRYSEIWGLVERGKEKAAGRGYGAADLETLSQLGGTAGYMAVLVLALYINSDTVVELYDDPRVIWFLCPLVLYLVSRIWLLARRGQVDEDPVVFVVRDRHSRIVAVIGAILFWLAM
jgi:4-hydroxybenzoate polyprenyltransferase/phosphoserine phosphatase